MIAIRAVLAAPMKVPTAVITAARLMVSLGGRRRAGLFLVQRDRPPLGHEMRPPLGHEMRPPVGKGARRASTAF